ncbi:MAG: hypothetical protein GY714_09555 [Desulfobacterales bacterium]|nr:hypothetical protein [Desulfobacterales bacterium]MCP4161156.1 hypothetical protein [Deltaproteobacteria bacterium]
MKLFYTTLLLLCISCISPDFTASQEKGKSNFEFNSLETAMGFIINCVESKNPELLINAIKHNQKEQSYSEKYKKEFLYLSYQHKKGSLQGLIKGMPFPKDKIIYKVGGHGKQYGNVHIVFEKYGDGWGLKDIWHCR